MAHIHLDEDGTYPAYAWPGGYPIYYLMQDGETMCPKCANENRHLDEGAQDHSGWHVVGQDINWEDPEMFCCHCNERIESAYAEPD